MQLQEPGDLGRLDIVVMSCRACATWSGEDRGGPNHITRALAAIQRGAIK